MSRIRIGVVGCGAIAQVHHLPNLNTLHREFEVPIVCDLSPGAAQAVAKRFHVPQFVTDYNELYKNRYRCRSIVPRRSKNGSRTCRI